MGTGRTRPLGGRLITNHSSGSRTGPLNSAVRYRMMKSRNRFGKWSYLSIVIVILLLNGCAQHYTSATYSDPYGFFSGIWHGIISPFSLIANLISWVLSLISINIFTDIQIIGRPNIGFFFYYIGFILGLCVWFGSGAASSGSR